MTHEREHREPRLDKQTILPRAARTEFEVGRIALGGMEGGITQDNHAFCKLAHQPLQRVLGDMGGGTRPPDDQPRMVS